MSNSFDREIWKRTMDWLCTGESGLPEDPEKQKRLALAAQLDPDVAQVDAWRAQAEPLADWALHVNRETPHWGVEICNKAWPAYLEAQLDNISQGRWRPAGGGCGRVSPARQQATSYAIQALENWLAGAPPDARNPLAAKIGSLLGERDDPLRIPTTAGIMVGLWAWLRGLGSEDVSASYPDFALLAERVRRELGEATPIKRWLAGRLFVGVRVWLQDADHGHLAPPQPALETYPTLGG